MARLTTRPDVLSTPNVQTKAPSVPFLDMMGARLHPIDLASTVDIIEQLLVIPGQHVVMTANVDHLVRLAVDPVFREAYGEARVRTIDGAPVAWLARVLGHGSGAPVPRRAPGADLMPLLLALAAEKELRVLFVGGSPETVVRASARVASDLPDARVSFLSPSRGFDTDPLASRRLQEEVAAHAADIVFCCLGAPKQENWWLKYGPTGPSIVLHCGAALDFWAGTSQRAPQMFRSMGIEWLWRLAMEPRRLWRRYLVDDRAFFSLVWNELRSQRSNPRHGTETLEPLVIDLPR